MTARPRTPPPPSGPPTSAPGSAGAGRSRLMLGAVAVVIVVAAAVAILLGGGGTGGTGGTGEGASPAASAGASATVAPSSAAASSAVASSAAASSAAPSSAAASSSAGSPAPSASGSASTGVDGVPVISGSLLPPFPRAGDDPAKGLTAPTVQGASFDGTPVAIAPTGRPTVILFIAHWCPHCQREVALIQSWIDANGLPQGVDFVSVATGIDPTLPNYPPEAWLASVGWTVPVIVDPTNSVAEAYGLSAYPFWVFLDGNGVVVERATGEMTIAGLVSALAALTGT
jgi:cytochrome c biogenesis protein CcmG/thiol:disulfide interchange protein DsbE